MFLVFGALTLVFPGCQTFDLAKIAGRNFVYEVRNPVQSPAARLEAPSRSNLRSSNEIRASWIGHSTVLISFQNTFILTDPVFSKRVKIARRVVSPPINPGEIKDLDFILISHGHYDHLDLPSLKQLPTNAVLIVPEGYKTLVDGMGFKVVELKWGEMFTSDTLTIEAFRPSHWGRRKPWDEDRGYNSYLLSKNGKTILFAGDTGPSKIFEEKGRERGVILSFFPITAYKPEWFRRSHANPEEALQMFLESGARYMIPIHWGTFILSHEPLDEPVARLKTEAKRLAIDDRVIILRHGESFTIPE